MDAQAREAARRDALAREREAAAAARRAAGKPAAGPVPGATFEETALPLLEEARKEWLALARETAIALAAEIGDLTVNDLRERCPPPEGADPRCMGAVLRNVRAVAHLGRWERVRDASIDSARARGRPLCLFRWVPARPEARRGRRPAQAARGVGAGLSTARNCSP